MSKDIDFSRGGLKKLVGKAKGRGHDTLLWSYKTCRRCGIVVSTYFLAIHFSYGLCMYFTDPQNASVAGKSTLN